MSEVPTRLSAPVVPNMIAMPISPYRSAASGGKRTVAGPGCCCRVPTQLRDGTAGLDTRGRNG
jgi:hypothetical protein